MSTKIQHIGIDVDDKSFHGYALREGMPGGVAFCSKPTLGALIRKLEKTKVAGVKQKICYEASYLGFTLQRSLKAKGYECEVIAPSLIPQTPGKRVKTDKIDSKQLAIYYQKGLLTAIEVPDEEEEILRDLIRSRQFLLEQTKSLKRHLLSFCRRRGMNYRQATGNERGHHWTQVHWRWLEGEAKKADSEHVRFNLSMLCVQIRAMQEQVAFYEEKIRKASEEGAYVKKVKALCCYRGLDVLGAMTLIAEIGDIKRFAKPKKLMSYAGMDIQEYSSGGKEKKYRITKMGNRYIRTTLIEASQFASKVPRLSRSLKERRKGAQKEWIDIADRCMRRLYKKSTRLLGREKPRNKVKVACAREWVGFIWESLRAVQ